MLSDKVWAGVLMLEAAIVAVLVFAVWLAIQGGIGGMPAVRGSRPKLRASRLPFRFGLRSLLIAVTLIAVLLGILAISD